MTGPLDGLVVVEMAGLGPCPLAGQLLADMGADVIVIDRKSDAIDKTDVNRRGKRSIALNLKLEAGHQIALRLISKADILLEGFRPGVMEKLGLGPQQLEKHNPGLIFGRMTGWGQEGPLSHSAGHDINYLSITGALHAIGIKENPIPPLNLAADYGGGTMFLIFGVLAALYERNVSGKGQVVDAAMVDGVPAMMGLIHSFFAKGEWSQARQSNLLDGGAPFYRCYETADNRHMSVGALEPQFFAELIEKLGVTNIDLARQNDPDTWDEMKKKFAECFKQKTMTEWTAIFEGSDACVAPVLTFEEAEKHHHNVARSGFLKISNILQSAPAPRFSRSAVPMPALSTAPGEQTDTILSAIGYSDDDIELMRADGILT